LSLPLRGDIPNHLIERPAHLLRLLPRNLYPEPILDLIEHLGEVNVGIDFAGVVLRSNTSPAIAELLNLDLANADRNVLGYAAVGVVSLIESSIVRLWASLWFSLKVRVKLLEEQIVEPSQEAFHGFVSQSSTSLIG
jgi:hypothetical protein